MREILQTIISNILTALYQPFWYAVLASVLLCFLYLYAYYPVNTGKGLKVAIKTWMKEFRKSVFFRKLFVLSFFTVMILFQTLFNRNMWTNPLSNIMGGSEKDVLKNPGNNEKPRTLDFSLQSSATKPYDMSRIMGQPVESKNETTATQSALQQPTSQEGK